MTKERRVVCAAIRGEDGRILLGIRHYSEDMYNQLRFRTDAENFYHRTGLDQGFVDQYGVYMTRREAYQVAHAAKQIINYNACLEDDLGYYLYSEGLY